MTDGWGRVERPDAELWFHDTGEDLPVVVLLHGLAGHALEWAATTTALRGRRRVISLDLRGHGSSTRRPEDVSRAAYVADVVAVLDDLDVVAVPLVGHSFGGHVALLVAAARPDRVSELVLVESGLGGGRPAETAAMADWLRGWPAPFPDRDHFLAFFGGSRIVSETWADGLEERPDGLWPRWDADTLAGALAEATSRELLEEWAAVSAPTLLVRGEHGAVPQRQVDSMCALRPDTEVTVVAGAGHDLHLEAPDALAGVLSGFLARHTS